MSKALLIIDMQQYVVARINKGIDHYPHNAMTNMTALLRTFRDNAQPVIHIRHHSPAEGSLLHPDSPLSQVIADFAEKPSEAVFIKHTSSSFSSTGLQDYLARQQISECVVMGAVAGFCVNSTVRAGADLGLEMTVVSDAVISFGLADAGQDAKTIFEVTMALLRADFARVATSQEIKAEILTAGGENQESRPGQTEAKRA